MEDACQVDNIEEAYTGAEISCPNYTEKELELQRQHGLSEDEVVALCDEYRNMKNLVQEREAVLGSKDAIRREQPIARDHAIWKGIPQRVMELVAAGDFRGLRLLGTSAEGEEFLRLSREKGNAKGKGNNKGKWKGKKTW